MLGTYTAFIFFGPNVTRVEIGYGSLFAASLYCWTVIASDTLLFRFGLHPFGG